jgi:6-phosphogluconolactonase
LRRRWRRRLLSRLLDADLTVLPTPEAAALAAAELLARAARGGAAIALSGGSTPRRSYELAAEITPDWGNATVWLADERLVPPEDQRSNARLVEETLLVRLGRRPETHFVHTELPADESAADYDRALRSVDVGLVLLGVGPDGHTASLFPHAPSLVESDLLAVAAEAQFEPFVPRVTLTLPALRAAQAVVFLVTGAEKADAVKLAFGEEPSPATPASLVRSERGTTTVLLDAAAASLLDQ